MIYTAHGARFESAWERLCFRASLQCLLAGITARRQPNQVTWL